MNAQVRNQVVVDVGKFECGHCADEFEALTCCTQYGNFIVRSSAMKLTAFLDARSDGIAEIHRVVDDDPRLRGMYVATIADVIRAVIEEVADEANDRSRYRITELPPCPQCGTWSSRFVGLAAKPSQVVDIPQVQFSRLLQMTPLARESSIRSHFQRCLKAVVGRPPSA